jgi:hypothetical protein
VVTDRWQHETANKELASLRSDVRRLSEHVEHLEGCLQVQGDLRKRKHTLLLAQVRLQAEHNEIHCTRKAAGGCSEQCECKGHYKVLDPGGASLL